MFGSAHFSLLFQRFNDKHGTKKLNVEVWMASTLGNQSMLSIMNLSQKNASPQVGVSVCCTSSPLPPSLTPFHSAPSGV